MYTNKDNGVDNNIKALGTDSRKQAIQALAVGRDMYCEVVSVRSTKSSKNLR